MNARHAIAEWPGWTLVLVDANGCICMDASTEHAVRMMETRADQVVGIYWHDQSWYLDDDLQMFYATKMRRAA